MKLMPESSSESPQTQPGSGLSPAASASAQQQHQQQQRHHPSASASASQPSSSAPLSANENNSHSNSKPNASTTTQQQQQSFPPSTLSRPFRSRKNRPCDACVRPLPFYFLAFVSMQIVGVDDTLLIDWLLVIGDVFLICVRRLRLYSYLRLCWLRSMMRLVWVIGLTRV